MNIPKHKSQSALRRRGLVRTIQIFEAQQPEMGPSSWKADICDLPQCDQSKLSLRMSAFGPRLFVRLWNLLGGDVANMSRLRHYAVEYFVGGTSVREHSTAKISNGMQQKDKLPLQKYSFRYS